MASSILIIAKNVKSAGGLRLLSELLNAKDDRNSYSLIVAPEVSTSTSTNLNVLKRRFLLSYLKLFYFTHWDYLVSFGNFPLPFYYRHQTLFIQNMILVCDEHDKLWTLRSRIILKIKRLLLYIFIKSCGANLEIVVQTNTMRRQVRKFLNCNISIHVVPFAQFVPKSHDYNDDDKLYDYFYPAAGEPHKNHIALLKAWEILGAYGLKPKLLLTIDEKRYSVLVKTINDLNINQGLKIINLGFVREEEMLELYKRSQSIVFPSLMESFGLPLVDAGKLGLQIVASELDYVREVCSPDETFNPASPYSLANAIFRHQSIGDIPKVRISEPKSFWLTSLKNIRPSQELDNDN